MYVWCVISLPSWQHSELKRSVARHKMCECECFRTATHCHKQNICQRVIHLETVAQSQKNVLMSNIGDGSVKRLLQILLQILMQCFANPLAMFCAVFLQCFANPLAMFCAVLLQCFANPLAMFCAVFLQCFANPLAMFSRKWGGIAQPRRQP